jgi:NDP-sugar pyrophosphorylase family protein
MSKPFGAIILAGGESKRLRPLTEDRHKGLLPLDEHTIIDHQLAWLHRYGVKDIVLACGYKWERYQEHLGSAVKYSLEKTPLGTAGAARQALAQLDDPSQFLCFNVDDLTDVDIHALARQGPDSVVLVQLRSPYGVFQDGKFVEKPLLPHWISAGQYFLSQDALANPGPSLEQDVFPKLHLKPYRHEGYWHTINTLKDLEEARAWFSKHQPRTHPAKG